MASMADSVLKVFRAISRWVQQRDEDYSAPLTTGMSRVPKAEARRKQILDDEEIRAIWGAAGQYGDFVRLALLTAQRRDKLHTLRWDDLDANGVWTIRTALREKGNPGKLALPKVALDIIRAQPRLLEIHTYSLGGMETRRPRSARGSIRPNSTSYVALPIGGFTICEGRPEA